MRESYILDDCSRSLAAMVVVLIDSIDDDCLGKKNKVKKGITLKSKVVTLKHLN